MIRILFIVSLLNLLSINTEIKDHTYDPSQYDFISLGPPNYQVYEYIIKHQEKYNIPLIYMFKCAYKENTFRGKFDFYYKPYKKSFAGALGPMQVKLTTAQDYWKRPLTEEELTYNVELNVESSYRHLKYLYSIYGNWTKVFSVYNQGWKGADSLNRYSFDVVEGNKWYQKFIPQKKLFPFYQIQ